MSSWLDPIYQAQAARNRPLVPKTAGKVVMTCLHCGKQALRYASKGARFCSRGCGTAYYNQRGRRQ